MYSVLIVSGGEKTAAAIEQLLVSFVPCQVSRAQNSGEARRLIGNQDFDAIMINTPLPDEFGDGLATMACETTYAGVLLLVAENQADEISATVEEYGVLVAPKPLSRTLLHQMLHLVFATRRRLVKLQHENFRLQGRMEEIRLIDRAKCALIQYLNLTEPQAHRYIEKEAMNRRTTRREIAEGILKTYE